MIEPLIHPTDTEEWLPTVSVAPDRSRNDLPRSAEDQDIVFAFFNECWRILKPEGVMTITVPALLSNRGFQNPTHCRFLPAGTFLDLNRKRTEMNRFGHDRVDCDFTRLAGQGAPLVKGHVRLEEGQRSPEVQAVRAGMLRRAIANWGVVLNLRTAEGGRV